MNKRAVLMACVVILGTAAVASARPAHKQALADYFGQYMPRKLNDCRTCHLPDPPGQKPEEVEKRHNAFGARLKAVKEELRQAGKKTTLDARLDTVLHEDSDGDGAGNLVELLSGHFPGDKADGPTAAELAESKKLVAAFLKAKSGYPWRPFEIVKRPQAPKVKNTAWLRNPIDAFIAAEHEELGLKPRPEVAKTVLLRRVYLDLIGLPPTADELHAFLSDNSAGAYEKVVESLLASPQYGERWGRHWMDVWRYSDWAGYGPQVRDSQPHIWRWRDWIVESLNEDKGYDRMVLEMLAGDELAPEDPKALAATGYLVRNFKLLSREKWMQDTVDHTGQAFLGLTLGCAKCHDHMYDPILQKEYYMMRAIFEPHQVRIDRLPGQPDLKKDGLPRVYDADLATPTYLFVRGDDRTPDKSQPLPPGVPEVLGERFAKIAPVKLPASAVSPEKRDFVIRETLEQSTAAVAKAAKVMAAARFKVQKTPPGMTPEEAAEELGRAEHEHRVVDARHSALEAVLRAERLEDEGKLKSPEWREAAETATKAQRWLALLEARQKIDMAKRPDAATKKDKKFDAAKVLAEGEKALAKAEAEWAKPLDTSYTKRALKSYPAESSGRRLALARWIADVENPLTARVAVNHMWMRHFGQAIVPSVSDFGRNGRPPSHPALLDWLAAEFMAPSVNGAKPWSMKHLHRLIVTSSTYRLGSTPDVTNAGIDRDNKYVWRMAPRRLEAEAIRDSIFHVAGTLERTLGGPDIDYPQALTVPRRTIYFRHAAEKESVWMLIFDGPSVTECYERKPSVVPQQALALFNSDTALRNARILARQLASKTSDPATFATAAFEQVLTRPPTPQEMQECTAFIEEQTRTLPETKSPAKSSDADGRQPSPDPAIRARENLVHVLMNHHEFVTIR